MLSTLVELRKNLKFVETSIADAELTINITDADKIVYDDLSKTVDWDDIEGLSYTPRVINRLSQYQSCMITIVRNWLEDDTVIGDGPEAKNNGYDYWERMYDKLLNQIKAGDIAILDNSNDELTSDYVRPLGPGRII